MSIRLAVLPLGFALVCAASPAVAAPAAPPAATEAEAPIDPARLEMARKTVEFLFPAGTYAKMMDRTLNGMMKPMMDSVGKIPLRELAAIGGVPEEKLAGMSEGTLGEMMEIVDPAFKERTAAFMPAMFGMMQGMMGEFEPIMRAGLARAYARRFDTRQLAVINAFFATPTGHEYAASAMLIFTDPDVMNTMQELVPMMMKRMPDMMKRVEADMARFPPRRKLEDLTPQQRKRLSELLGSGAAEAPSPDKT
jgi:hypothetical protein